MALSKIKSSLLDGALPAVDGSAITGITHTPASNSVDETKVKDAFVADFTEVTVATGDSILLGDATDSGNTKRDTVQGILDLAGGGGLNLISKIVVTGTPLTVNYLTSFSSTYDTYLFTWHSTQPTTDGCSLGLEVAQGGTAQTSGSYHRALKAHNEANGAANNGSTVNTQLYLSGTGTGNATVDEHCNGNLWVYNPLSSAVTGMHWQTWVNNQLNIMWYETGAGGYFGNNTALTGLQFVWDGGPSTFKQGEFLMYGLAKS